ncbi:dTDP-4-amino-4,6-dideoxygalactose transaminase [Desulfonatronum zhilinae]|nr:dTDP-4-amino-4,6-dideoxygalactose transaminase [Desulfonatronum zhilinae]
MNNSLSIYGGEPIRKKPFPPRRLFGEDELNAVIEVFQKSWESGIDFGYQGIFEDAYISDFCKMQGGGYADAVSSGTAAVYIAIAALGLPPRSEVVCSPVTDPGGITPLIVQGLHPVVADAAPGGFNIGAEQLETAITSNTRALLVTHVGGIPVDMFRVGAIAKRYNLAVIEDCSQAHGACINGIQVGNFGDIAAFSTMYSKNHASGGCGGIVFTRDYERYKLARAIADRGKPCMDDNFDPKNPGKFLFSALNFNQDEISCAIGRSTLRKLSATIARRQAIMLRIAIGLEKSRSFSILLPADGMDASPFFLTIRLEMEKFSVCKREIVKAIKAEGIPINPDYRYVLAEWPWLAQYCPVHPETPNAINFRKSSFNILFNERFSDADVEDISAAMLKVEKALKR